MSLPKLPLLDPPITREEAINQIIASIAMEELALSHIINAEGEKLQYILGTSGPGATIDDVLKVNESVRAVLQRAAECQSALKNKLQNVLSSAVLTGPAGPAGPTGATGPAGLTRAAATIGVDPSVEHVPYAGQPYVVNIGTHYDAVLRFGIPGGMPGKPGATGATGPEGPPGATGPVGKPGNPIESYHFDLSEQNDIFNLALKNIIYRLEHVGDHFRLMLLPVSSYVPISIDFKCATIFETTVDYVVRDSITLSNTLEVSNAIYLASRETHKIWIRQKDSKENKWFTCVVYLFASGQTGERVDVWVEWINEDITYDKPMNLYNLRSKKDDFPEKLAGGH